MSDKIVNVNAANEAFSGKYIGTKALNELVAQIKALDAKDQAAITAEVNRATGVENKLIALIGAAELAEGANNVIARVAALEGLMGEDDVQSQIEAAIAELNATVGEAEVAEGKHVAVEVVEEAGVITAVNVSEDDIASADALAKLQAVVGYSELASEGQDAKSVKARLEVIEGAETVAGSVAKALKDAKDYADGLDTAMDARVDALEATHATKTVGENTVFQTVAEEVNTAVTALVNGAPEALDTLKEIADWIANQDESGVTDVASLVARVDDNTAAIDVENLAVAEGAKVTIPNAIAKAVADAAADAGDLADLIGEIPEDSEAETVIGYVDEQVAAEAARIDAIVGILPAEKTVAAAISDVQANLTQEIADRAQAISDAIEALSDADVASDDVAAFVKVTVSQKDGEVTNVTVENQLAEMTALEVAKLFDADATEAITEKA